MMILGSIVVESYYLQQLSPFANEAELGHLYNKWP